MGKTREELIAAIHLKNKEIYDMFGLVDPLYKYGTIKNI